MSHAESTAIRQELSFIILHNWYWELPAPKMHWFASPKEIDKAVWRMRKRDQPKQIISVPEPNV